MRVGDKVRFTPCCYPGTREEARKVTGTIVEIHWAHRWARVRYTNAAGQALYETFKITPIYR